MKVLNTTDSTHTIKLVPRFYASDSVVLELKNEYSRETETVANTYSVSNGVVSIVFDYTFTDKQRFQFKLTKDSNVVYRGKISITDQDPQDFKLTKDLYQ